MGQATEPSRRAAGIACLAAMACLVGWVLPASAAQYGVTTAYTYSTPATSSPTIEGGSPSTIGGLGFSSPNGAGDLGGFAAAELHAVTASSFGEATATHVCRCIMQGVEIIMTAVAQDVVTPTGGVAGQPGRMRVTWWSSGSAGAVLGGTAGSVPLLARGFLSLLSFDPIQAGNGVVVTDPPNAGLAGFEYLQVNGTNHPAAADVPIRFGTPIGLRFKLVSRSQGSVVDGSFQAISSHTARILTVQLFDANGVPIVNPSLTTASGVPIAVVPEPSFAAGLSVAALALCFRGRRRSRSGSLTRYRA